MSENLKANISTWPPGLTAAVILGSTILNGALQLAVTRLEIPLFLDTTGTAIAAICFGPVGGVITGLLSNFVSELFQGFPGHLWPFFPVNLATGLTLGLIAKRWSFSRAPVIAASVVIVTLLNAFLGTLVVTLVFGGITSQAVDYVVTALVLTGRSIFSSAFLARLPINFVDKSIALLAGVAVWRLLLPYARTPET